VPDDTSSPSRFGLSYFRLIRVPGSATLAFWGTAGRLPIAMRSISILILISAVTGSLGNAGVVSAAMLIAQGLVSPVIGRLADRYGQRRVLLITWPAHALGIALLVVSIMLKAPLWTLIMAAVAAGCTAVSFGSLMLARWATLVEGAMLRTAYALESMLEEIVFLLGPLLVAAAVSAVHPAAGLVACGVLTAVGSIAVARHRRSEPVIESAAGQAPDHRSQRVISRPGVQVLMACYAGTGFLLGALDVTMIAFARERSAPWLGGVLLALVAAGSFTGGAVYGAVDWRLSKAWLLIITTGLLTLGAIPLAFANSFFLMAFLAVIAGAAIAPALIAGTTLLQSLAPKGSLSEAFSWLTSTGAVGIALGTAAAGRLAAHGGGSGQAAWTAVGGGIVALTLSVAGHPALRNGSAAEAASSVTT
jgi:MFS family permease